MINAVFHIFLYLMYVKIQDRGNRVQRKRSCKREIRFCAILCSQMFSFSLQYTHKWKRMFWFFLMTIRFYFRMFWYWFHQNRREREKKKREKDRERTDMRRERGFGHTFQVDDKQVITLLLVQYYSPFALSVHSFLLPWGNHVSVIRLMLLRLVSTC